MNLKPHYEYPDLYVAEDGRVFRELVGCTDSAGYMLLKVTTGQNTLTLRRHQIVLETFKGPRPEGCVGRHLDGDPSNDSPGNLIWGTQKENMQDAVGHGTTTKGSKNARAKLTEADVTTIKERLASGESGRALGQEFNMSESTMCDIKKGRTWCWLA